MEVREGCSGVDGSIFYSKSYFRFSVESQVCCANAATIKYDLSRLGLLQHLVIHGLRNASVVVDINKIAQSVSSLVV